MVESNNAINNTVGASISGVTNTLTVTNPSNTASSAARATITVGGASSGDPSLNFNVSGATDWEMGIDNNDSDNLKISQGTALGTNDTWIMTTAGERTMPLQPSFLAEHTVTQSNVTGDTTIATINYTSVIFDQNSDYDGTNTFTAPVTGRYLITGGITFRNVTTAYNNFALNLITSNRTYRMEGLKNPANLFNPQTDIYSGGAQICDMDAGDTARMTAFMSGSTKTIDFTANQFHFFSACLLV